MTEKPQLKMNWPAERTRPPSVDVPAGYELRNSDPRDEPALVALMAECGWDFGVDRIDYCYARLLPRGWFTVWHAGTSQLVGSAMSLHNYSGRSLGSGTLGWVGCHPNHRGRKIGSVVSAAVTARLLQAGYADIELYTEHFREAAIESYFRLGFIPYLYNSAVSELWRDVCGRIGRAYTPELWPSGNNAYPKT